MPGSVEQIIEDFLVRNNHVPPGTLGSYSQSLIGAGLIDSLTVLTLVEFLEERFGLRFDPADMTGDNFDSIAAMSRLVREQGDSEGA